MRGSLKLALLGAGLVLSSGCAHSGGAAATPVRHFETPQEAARELTMRVLPREAHAAMVGQMMAQVVQGLAGQGQELDATMAAALKAAVEECLPYDELVGWNAEIYGARFTVAELEQAIAFYDTPAGAKFAKALPEIGAEAMKKVLPIIAERLPEALRKHGLIGE